MGSLRLYVADHIGNMSGSSRLLPASDLGILRMGKFLYRVAGTDANLRYLGDGTRVRRRQLVLATRLQKALACCDCHRLCPAVDPQLIENRGHVVVHRLGRDEEVL